ncbi:MAG: DUF4099 domain-containing protein [Bacteroidales bacterium]|nr:DUF4099 domain-containing protein [Bacteroidales bacterium]
MAKLTIEDLPWEEMKQLGITKEVLEKTNNLETLLNYGKTDLLAIKGKLPNVEITGGHAKFFMRSNSEGKPELRVELCRKFPNFKSAIYGQYLTEEQQNTIKDGGCAKLTCNTSNGELNLLVSLDKDTNQLNHVEVGKAHVPDKIAGAEISQMQKDMLLGGMKVKIDGMKNKEGQAINASVAYNAVTKGLVFIFDNNEGRTVDKSNKRTVKKTQNL